RINRYHSDQRDIVKVVPLGDHLGPHQQIDCAGRKLHQDMLKAASAPRRVAVQPDDVHRRKHLPQPGLDLLGSLADIVYVFAVAGWAALGNRPDVVAVVALKAEIVFVEGECDVAVLTLDGQAAGPAYQE